MVVFIFPAKNLDAGKVQEAILSKAFPQIMNVDLTYREAKPNVMRFQHLDELNNIVEAEEKASDIVIDPELGFTINDIPDYVSFGNGVTIGQITLKNGKIVPCGWVVFDHADKPKVIAKMTTLKNIFKGMK